MMNVLFCADAKGYIGLELALYTLLTHNKHVNVYIFTMDIILTHPDGGIQEFHSITEEQRSKLRKITHYLSNDANIAFVDVSSYYAEHLEGNANEYSSFTPYATLRLLVDIVLPYIDHILYLDCDVAIQSNLEDMYNQYAHLNTDYSAFSYNEACNYEGEMVSGVIVFNLAHIRESGFLESARNNLMKNEYHYPDQMALRDAGTPHPLPQNYNYMEPIEECCYTPAILHFTNRLSPKIYTVDDPIIFYRRYPQFEYVRKGLILLDTLNI